MSFSSPLKMTCDLLGYELGYEFIVQYVRTVPCRFHPDFAQISTPPTDRAVVSVRTVRTVQIPADLLGGVDNPCRVTMPNNP